jgi:hypothetical protein
MLIDISGDIKVKLPGRFKKGNGYNFIEMYNNNTSYGFYGYDDLNVSKYVLPGGQNINNMFYLNENDVVYERDAQKDIWYAALKNKVRITREVPSGPSSIYQKYSNLTGNVVLEIYQNWDISLTFYSKSLDKSAWVYGLMKIETDRGDIGKLITKYEGDVIGINRGKYYSIRPCGDGATGECKKNFFINIIQQYNQQYNQYNYITSKVIKGIKYNNVLPLKNLNDFIRIDVSSMYYLSRNQYGNTYGIVEYNRIQVNHFDRIGIRQPFLSLTNYPKISDTSQLNITIPQLTRYLHLKPPPPSMVNKFVDISDALDYDQNSDGSFKITIRRPISIIYYESRYYSPTNDDCPRNSLCKQWRVTFTITIDTEWNVTYTYTTPDEGWLDWFKKDKNVQGEMRMLVNEVNNKDDVTLKKTFNNDRRIIVTDNGNAANADNYNYIGWAYKKNMSVSIKYTNNTISNQKNVLNVTSLDNIIRFDSSFVSYYFTYSKGYETIAPSDALQDTSPEFKDEIIEHTIILYCRTIK